MSILLVVLGVSVLALALFDLAKTTLVSSPYGGPLTARVAQAVWLTCVRLSGNRRSNFVGPCVLLAMLLTWLVFSWAGWALLFMATEGAVIESSSGRPADLAARIYFAGYSLFTLGIGDYRPNPNGAFWQLATVVSTAQGFTLITLSVTYIVPVVSAVTQKRQLATLISHLGEDPSAIVTSAWNGRDFGQLEQQLITLTPSLVGLQQQHYAYPVLHYFNGAARKGAVVPAIATLDEALMLFLLAVGEEARPDANVLRGARQAIGEYLDMLETVHIEAAEVAPPPPSLRALRSAGIPTVTEEVFQGEVARLERRRLLLALLERDGWPWVTDEG
jgi:hypothetical protein